MAVSATKRLMAPRRPTRLCARILIRPSALPWVSAHSSVFLSPASAPAMTTEPHLTTRPLAVQGDLGVTATPSPEALATEPLPAESSAAPAAKTTPVQIVL